MGRGFGGAGGSSGGPLRYDRMVDRALRGVVREALRGAAEHGLPGAHHFYITFRTHAAGVEIADYLRNEYPETMTIVLQHQYWGLDITEDSFAVTLSFRKVHERLVIPFSALAAFADPSVNFALQFDMLDPGRAREPRLKAVRDSTDTTAEASGPVSSEGPPHDRSDAAAAKVEAPVRSEGRTGADVVAIDAFRKK